VTRFAKLVHASPLTRADKARLLKPTWDGRTERPAVEVAADRMRDDRPWPSSGGGPGQKGGVSDPTFSRMLEGDNDGHELKRLRKAIAKGDGDQAVRIVQAWTPRPPSAKALRETSSSNEPGCARHARIDVWAPVHRRGTVNGNLDNPEDLCRPCYEFVARTGEAPTDQELRLGQRAGKLRPRRAVSASSL